MEKRKTYRLDGNPLEKYAVCAVNMLRKGDYLCFKMFDDSLIEEFASPEEYEFWITEKKKAQAFPPEE